MTAAPDHETLPTGIVDVSIEDERWSGARLQELAETAAKATLQHLGIATDQAEISLLGCDDARIRTLNADFRGKAAATNVLSWPSEDLSAGIAGTSPEPPAGDPDGHLELGDIAVSYDTCLREAAEQGKTLADHVTHLIVHGVLHLLGYDHQRDPDATLMEGLEAEILGKLGVDDPYRG